ncbi:hypothetical protein HCC36_16110 [Listeria booriae]|uniref:Uncharacterized protein n=1 Tax=Listeria booriae TaxID=1552123 RepID=A0A842FVT6_9LIST|nr:hypothetical protein [Listeria booriae]MBC2294748.1 hypothetical protein [Listeria booriae]
MQNVRLNDFVEKWNCISAKKISEVEALDMIKERMDSFEWQDGVRLRHHVYLSKEQMLPDLHFISDARFSFWFGLHNGKKTVEYTGCNH